MGMRLAEPRDVKPLAHLLGELAGREGELLGVCAFRIRENIESVGRYGEVSAIVVHPGARRRGIGRIMPDFMEELAREKQCAGLWLVSGFGREEEAHKFYRDYGFRVTGCRFVKRF